MAGWIAAAFCWLRRMMEPKPRTLRLFLVRTGEYKSLGSAVSERVLTRTGQAQSVDAAAEISQRLGDVSAVVVRHNGEKNSAYQQTLTIIAGALGAQVVRLDEGNAHIPADFELDAYGAFGKVLVMVVNGTELADELSRQRHPDAAGLSVWGPPHGAVYEMVITYQPATALAMCHSITRQFV